MNYIDMHAHMVSRSTDDYEAMALMGCVAVTEPAFWAGYDRVSADAFADYFHHLTRFEPQRAAAHDIDHYSWLCLNPKEGEDRQLARKVLEIIPRFLDSPRVVGIGEIGLNRVTRNELATFQDHVDLAVDHDQLILIHTPHLEDKWKGTKVILETLAKHPGVRPERVLVDHAEEHTLPMILDHGFWAGITLYPETKASPARAIDLIEMHGGERVVVNSACDWGPSQPTAVPRFARAMKRRGHDADAVRRIVFDNPDTFLSRCDRWTSPART